MNSDLTNSDLKLIKQRLKIEWTYTSNAIEGNTISLGDTAFIIEHGLTIKGKSVVEHADIIGHAKAVDLIYELIQKDTITEQDIFALHKAVQTNLIVNIYMPIGEYKVESNARYIKVEGKLEHRYYPLPEHTKYLMGLWFERFGDISKTLMSFDECVKLYTDMHIAFSSIHPFFDGNGRLSRLISNIPLLKNGYLPVIVNNEDRQEYIELLSSYDMIAPQLNDKTKNLIDENEFYPKLLNFFKDQYKNSQKLLDEIRSSKCR